MRTDIKLHKINELKEQINQFTHKEKSLLERYEINYSGMLIYSDKGIDINFTKSHIRDSDAAVALTPNLMFIVYSVVDGQHALQAGQNILDSYHKQYPAHSAYAVLTSQDQSISATELGSRLIQLLQFAMEQNITNTIVTYSDMNRTYFSRN